MINDPSGKRLYLTASERQAFLKSAAKTPSAVRSFCETLHYTGCRISEALNLTVDRVDLENETVVFETLKRDDPAFIGQFRFQHNSSIPLSLFIISADQESWIANSGLGRVRPAGVTSNPLCWTPEFRKAHTRPQGIEAWIWSQCHFIRRASQPSFKMDGTFSNRNHIHLCQRHRKRAENDLSSHVGGPELKIHRNRKLSCAFALLLTSTVFAQGPISPAAAQDGQAGYKDFIISTYETALLLRSMKNPKGNPDYDRLISECRYNLYHSMKSAAASGNWSEAKDLIPVAETCSFTGKVLPATTQEYREHWLQAEQSAMNSGSKTAAAEIPVSKRKNRRENSKPKLTTNQMAASYAVHSPPYPSMVYKAAQRTPSGWCPERPERPTGERDATCCHQPSRERI